MNAYCVVEDTDSEYFGQVGILIKRYTVGGGLGIYECRMRDGNIIGLLAYQLKGNYLLRSKADEAAKSLRNNDVRQ